MMITDELVTQTHVARTQRLRASWRRSRRQDTDNGIPMPEERGGLTMDTSGAVTRLEAALTQQLTLAGDPALEQAGRTLLSALAPATQRLALELAQQAAEEVSAQLPDHDVDVVLREGEPALAVRAQPGAAPPDDEDLEARITLRLPPSLKARVEEAAGSMGDSVNSWVLKALQSNASRSSSTGRRVQGTVRT